MKCPSCGIWNRAHFTKCFRCGADLPPASEADAGAPVFGKAVPPAPQEEPDEPMTLAADGPLPADGLPPADGPLPADGLPPAEEPPFAEAPRPTNLSAWADAPEAPAASAAPEAPEAPEVPAAPEAPEAPEAPAAPAEAEAPEAVEADALEPGEIFSLYDEGDWADDEEEDTEEVYGFPPAQESAAEEPAPAAPLIRPVEAEDEDDEPVTVYRAPQRPRTHQAARAPEAQEDEEPVTVYRAPQRGNAPAPSAQTESATQTEPAAQAESATQAEPAAQPAPQTAPAEDEEPATVYRAPQEAEEPAQETRRFAPVVGKQPAAQPAPNPIPAASEPEIAPPDPAISHEIIHAIFTNPPAHLAGGRGTSPVDEPRPRKLMSRKRLPPAPEAEDEPQTVYKARPPKAEPRVERVADFKPTARLAAKKADEQGDEFTAFATAKRNLVAEVQNTDPFDEAIELPRPAEPEKAEPAPEAETPQEAPQPEQPAWVKEALINLGQEEFTRPRRAAQAPRRQAPQARTPQGRTPQERTPQARTPQTPISEETSSRHERALRMEREREMQEREALAQQESPRRSAPRANRGETGYGRQAPDPNADFGFADEVVYGAPARSGLDAIARHEAARSTSVLQRRAEEHPTAGPARARREAPREMPREMPEETVTRRREAPVSSAPRRREAPREQEYAPRAQSRERRLPAPERPTRAPRAESPMRPRAPRGGSGGGSDDGPGDRGPGADSPSRSGSPLAGLRVQNLQRMILVGAAALVLLALIVFGAVMGIRALLNREPAQGSPEGSVSPSQTPAQEVDPNAPTVTTGEVNGRPGHIITFKGNDGDLIYVTNEDLGTSYNVSIAGGVGTLQVEDSALIGDRIVNEDVEVTLTPVLHEAGSGRETNMDPITFVVTPPDAYLEIVNPAGGAADTTLGTYQVQIRVETGSTVTIAGEDVSDMITEEEGGVGSIIYNVDVTPTGENTIPIVVMKEGCKSVTQDIVITRPVMEVPIELDASTPSTVETDTVTISGSVAPGVQIEVTSPTQGDVTLNEDGTFSFVAQMPSFGENDVVITATSGDKSSTLTHTITYLPTANEYVEKAFKMEYANLGNYAGTFQPFLCTGSVTQVLSTDPYTCLYNVGTAEEPQILYLEMVEGKSLEEGKTYNVYADVHADGTHDGYPYMIGRYFYDAQTTEE